MNRLTKGTAGTLWGNTYTYDAFGNLWQFNQVTGTGTGQSGVFSPGGYNELNGAGMQYDSAGNMVTDNVGNVSLFDAENRIGKENSTVYGYDGDGHRVSKVGGSVSRMYWYGANGEVLQESDGTGTFTERNIYFGGVLRARRDVIGTINYILGDGLGSNRVTVNGSGVVEDNIDYYPYGMTASYSTSTSTNLYKFTGKERDTESGNDYFEARYYSSSMGRFMSPDWSDTPMAIPYGDLENPQSLNMYAYVNNNPLSNVDDDGHSTDCGGGGDKSVVCLVTSAWDWLKSHLGGSGSGSGSSNGDVAPPGGPNPNSTPQLHTRPAQTPGTVNNQQFANWLNNNAQDHSTGRCAAYCRQGLEAGGLNTAGHPVDAKNYGPFLLQHGYHVVQDANYFGNQQVGDIAVFQPAPGHSQSGHIESWTGSGWVSDFKQNHFSPYHGLGPSDLDYKIYRQQ